MTEHDPLPTAEDVEDGHAAVLRNLIGSLLGDVTSAELAALNAGVAALAAQAVPAADAVRNAALVLYMAGRWSCEGVPQSQQALMWENLRDALGLNPGTATNAGVAALASAPAAPDWVLVPRELPFAVLGEAAIAGVFETGNPKHGWDYLLARVAKAAPAPAAPVSETKGASGEAVYGLFRALVDAGGPDTIARHGVERGSDEWSRKVRAGMIAIERQFHPERFDDFPSCRCTCKADPSITCIVHPTLAATPKGQEPSNAE